MWQHAHTMLPSGGQRDDGPWGAEHHLFADGPRRTPEELLAYFARVQSDPWRDMEAYEECLHSDYYFTFTTEDAEEIRESDPTFPGFWTREEDLAATGNMFAEAVCIQLSIAPTELILVEPCWPGGPECRIYVVEVALAVEVMGDPENTTYLVGGLANIAMTRDPGEPQAWVIYEILDRTNEIPLGALAGTSATPAGSLLQDPLVENTGWGHVKYLFVE